MLCAYKPLKGIKQGLRLLILVNKSATGLKWQEICEEIRKIRAQYKLYSP
jgi:hypothetical protein